MPLSALLHNNRQWAAARLADDPSYFERLTHKQSPEYLWIGCSDSRVPAENIVGLEPGQLFVHRNIANLVVHADINALSVIEYAVMVLKVRHVIVCGHYGCGGVRAALTTRRQALTDHWLQNVRDVYANHQQELERFESIDACANRVVELNTLQQVRNVCHTTVVQHAWASGHQMTVHGVVYDIQNGHLVDLGCSVNHIEETDLIYRLSTQS